MASKPTPFIPIKSRGMQMVERRIGEPVDQGLHRRYVIERQTQDEIAAAFGVDRATVSRWMKEFGIETRYLGPRDSVA